MVTQFLKKKSHARRKILASIFLFNSPQMIGFWKVERLGSDQSAYFCMQFKQSIIFIDAEIEEYQKQSSSKISAAQILATRILIFVFWCNITLHSFTKI